MLCEIPMQIITILLRSLKMELAVMSGGMGDFSGFRPILYDFNILKKKIVGYEKRWFRIWNFNYE